MHTIPCLDALFTSEPYFPPVFRPSSIGSPNNTAVNTQLPLASIGQTKESNISQDHEKIRAWNQNLLEVINTYAHDLIAAQAKHQPDLPAICSWDGNLTYAKLDILSSRLADYLLTQGIGPEVIIPLCFKKSL
jgi:non-ribosomal peptide synthetase component F